MIKTLLNTLKQDKETFEVPRSVQDAIPIRRLWPDGVFQFGSKFSKTLRFSDINYAIASKEDKTAMFLDYSELLNALDAGSTTKITINNKHVARENVEQEILIPRRDDHLDGYRAEYNTMLLDKATNAANSVVQERYITLSVHRKSTEEARSFFDRTMHDVTAHLHRLDSHCEELDAVERLRVLHDFYRPGEENGFRIDLRDCMRKGHSFKDAVCPDSLEFKKDHFIMGNKYGRVLFLKEYASYIKDSMINELTALDRNLMLSIDKAGKFSSNEYIIRERPVPVPPAGPSSALPSSENPTTEYPAAGGTAVEKSTQIIKERQKKEQQRTDSRKKESLPIPSTPFPGTMDAKGRKRSRERPVDHQEMDAYRSLIRENIRYEDFVQERPWDVGQLDEMVELMVETVCSNRENVRVCGNDLPQAVVKSRLLKLDGSHIRYVFECLKDNTTHIRNIRQYLLTALYNAPATMENYYAAQVNHDLYGVAA